MPKYPKEVVEFLNNYEPAPYANLDTASLKKIKRIIAKHEAKARKEWDAARGAKATMQTMCPHVDKVVESKYHAGDYYYKAYTDYTVKCADCGSILFTTDKNHGHYG